jgi:RNA polymerase sigma factor (TIGR02999 family)
LSGADTPFMSREKAALQKANISEQLRVPSTITDMSEEVTRILDQIQHGDPHAAEQLLPLVYDELRQLAAQKLSQEKAGQTLQATALVHEAYLRLVGKDGGPQWDGRGHFFAAAAEAMRRILVENARRKQRHKHGGALDRVELAEELLPFENTDEDILAVHEALEQLTQHDPPTAELVKLHFFAGLTLEQAAELLNISPRTAYRNWSYARAWLFRRLDGSEIPPK